MRVLMIVASLCALALCRSAGATSGATQFKPIDSRKLGLAISVQGGGWGAADPSRIETVLYAVADQLLWRLPKRMAAPIVVTHTEGNPVALYERGHGGEYKVRLHASGERWYLYAYEFAHELCHIISNYDANLAHDRRRENQWFEETLCETASLYALKSLATNWNAAPPASEWGDHAPYFLRYFHLLINEDHRRLPADTRLAAWLASREQQLRKDPYQRKKNQLVANQLLPLFEQNPENWDALCYLNLEPQDSHVSFRQYLRHWHNHAPAKHKGFVAGVRALLDAVEDATTDADPVLADGQR